MGGALGWEAIAVTVNRLGFEPGVTYGLAIVGYRVETEAKFLGARWTSRGTEYLFQSTDDNVGGWKFGLMAEHIDHWRRVWTPIGGG